MELTWIGKGNRPRLEPRILIEDPTKSHHAPFRSSKTDYFDNRLIFGDNLLALKALEQEFAGKIKCIYIDPPYNTGSAFTHYDDGVEHSLWLSLIHERVEILRGLLSFEGSIWINLDDHEAHYCKALCDEVFGRSNFLADVIWEKADSPRMDAEFFSSRHDHILVYARDRQRLKINKGVTAGEELADHYDKTDSDGRPYYLKPLRAMGGDDARTDRPTLFFPMNAPDGQLVLPIRKDGSEGRWRWSKERTVEDVNLIEWVRGRAGWMPYYRIYGDMASNRPPETIWPHHEVGSNRTSKAEIKALFGGEKSFETPKPERLIHRVLLLASRDLAKFDSDPERRFAVVLEKESDREVLKWFRPGQGDLHIYYRGDDVYEADFVVETKKEKYICEVKASSEMNDPVVQDKARAAALWCSYASDHARTYGGKAWSYLLIPDTVIAENMTLAGLAAAHTVRQTVSRY